jgi:hypothetical protein
MFKSVKEIINEDDPTPWTGCEATEKLLRSQILERWGQKEADKYRAKYDARTFREWLKRKKIVNKGEHGLESFVVIEKKDQEGNVIKKYPKKIWLFHKRQVSPMQ